MIRVEFSGGPCDGLIGAVPDPADLPLRGRADVGVELIVAELYPDGRSRYLRTERTTADGRAVFAYAGR